MAYEKPDPAYDHYPQFNPFEGAIFDSYENYDAFDLAELEEKPLDIYKVYSDDIRRIPIMDPIETAQLAELSKSGQYASDALDMLKFAEIPIEDEVLQIKASADALPIAKEKIVIGHLRFAAHVARLTMGYVPWGQSEHNERGESVFRGARIQDLSRFAGAALPLGDRTQMANLGLISAADNYKPDGGGRFTTLAMYHVEQKIARAIQLDRNLHTPLHIQEILSKVRAHPETLGKNTFPDIEALGRRKDDPQAQLAHLEAIETILSTDALAELDPNLGLDQDFYDINDEPEPGFWDKYHSSDLESTLYEEIEGTLHQEAIRDSLDCLPEREKRILELRFGFDGGEPWTLEAIGHELNLTRERVRKLEAQALARLAALKELVQYTKSSSTPEKPASTPINIEKRVTGLENRLADLKLQIIKLVYADSDSPVSLQAALDAIEGSDRLVDLWTKYYIASLVRELYKLRPEETAKLDTSFGGMEKVVECSLPEEGSVLYELRDQIAKLIYNFAAEDVHNGHIKKAYDGNFYQWLTDLSHRANEQMVESIIE